MLSASITRRFLSALEVASTNWVLQLPTYYYIGENVTSAGWQVILCDPIWHVSSRSGEAGLLRTQLYPYEHQYTRLSSLFSRTTWVSRYQKGKTSLDLNEARDDRVMGWQWHQLDNIQTICTSLQTDNHINTLSLYFYRPDALPDAQSTVSKYLRHKHEQ